MLSYIHAFHAGNYGDILKHLVFKITIESLLKKDKPFTVIDTHSGSGLYKTDDERLIKTGEAESGIKRLFKDSDKNELKAVLGNEYHDFLETYLNKGYYPGSPETARFFMRKGDSLILNELHPAVINELKNNMKSPLLKQKNEPASITVKNMDAHAFLKASVPPAVKRGCVIIDPSYEDKDDYEKTAAMFLESWKKWSSASYLIWYPLLSHRTDEIELLKETVISAVEKSNTTKDRKAVFFEIKIKDPRRCEGLSKMYGSGMLCVNPCWHLNEAMEKAIPFLEKVLKEDS